MAERNPAMADTTEHASKDDSFKRALRPDQVQGPVAAQEYEGSQGGRDLTSATVGNPTNSERTAQAANGNTRTGKTEIPRAEDAVEAIKRADSVTDIPNGDGQVQSGSKKTNPRKHKKPSKTMRRQGSIRGRSLVSQSSSTESSESSTSSNSSSEEEPEDLRKRDKRPKRRTNRKPPGSSSIDREMDSEDSTKNTQESSDAQILALQHQVAQLTQICTALQQSISPPATAFYGGVHPGNPMLHLYPPATSLGLAHSPAVPPHSLPRSHIASKSSKRDRKPLGDLEKPLHASRAKSGETPNSLLEESVREKRVDFKRVDWVWDSSRYAYKLQDSAENANDSQYDGYIFHVRRSFDVEGKYRATTVDIKSKLLRECLQDVIGDIKGPSLVDETPKLDPNLLFLYLEDLRTHRKNLRHVKPAGDTKKERKRNQTRLDSKREQLKVLLTYLDKDYADVKESLYPMLENGLITFDLLWALWKPGTMAYTTTYGSSDDPRVFKVEQAEKHRSFMKGELYHLEGKYFEFDGKGFGHGTMTEEVLAFRGARRITSLPCYPLEYYENEQQLREKLIKRGQKFVSLHGVHYKSYSGMAYHKTKKSTIKFNIQQSRIMVDAAIFRRINPNYSVSPVRSKEPVLTFGGMSDEDSDAVDDSDSYDTGRRVVTKVLRARNLAAVMADGGSSDTESGQSLEPVASMPSSGPDSLGSRTEGHSAVAKDDPPTFSEEEYLMASPVVLGFSFAEKQWLEFTVDGVEEISWNDTAWDSLVSEPGTKDLIQALVKSRKYHAANTIDDVIRGKGKGLVSKLALFTMYNEGSLGSLGPD